VSSVERVDEPFFESNYQQLKLQHPLGKEGTEEVVEIPIENNYQKCYITNLLFKLKFYLGTHR